MGLSLSTTRRPGLLAGSGRPGGGSFRWKVQTTNIPRGQLLGREVSLWQFGSPYCYRCAMTSPRPTRSDTSISMKRRLSLAVPTAILLSASCLAWSWLGSAVPLGGQANAQEIHAQFRMCGSGQRHTCVVDGDTIWLEGMNLRLEAYDTPEPHNDICGGASEVALAKQASARLLELLNSYAFTVETFGTDKYGRTLATIRIQGTDVGDILISEGLARRWPDGPEFWC